MTFRLWRCFTNFMPRHQVGFKMTTLIKTMTTQVVYQLAEQDGDILSKFSVSTEGEVGVLTLTRALDFEEKSLYQVILAITITSRVITITTVGTILTIIIATIITIRL